MTTVINRLLRFVFSAKSKMPEKSAREKARAEFEAMQPIGAGAYIGFKKEPEHTIAKDEDLNGGAGGLRKITCTCGFAVTGNWTAAREAFDTHRHRNAPLSFPDRPLYPTKPAVFK